MPATSQAQLRAMFAAKAGNSTLGIPKSVGADFVAATPSAKGLPASVGAKASASAASSPPSGSSASAANPFRPSSAIEAMTGMPSGKKPVRRGRKKTSASPSAHSPDKHFDQLSLAHKKGDSAKAMIHALNYANAAKKKRDADASGEGGEYPSDNERTEPRIF